MISVCIRKMSSKDKTEIYFSEAKTAKQLQLFAEKTSEKNGKKILRKKNTKY
jgi:hypothetical protein